MDLSTLSNETTYFGFLRFKGEIISILIILVYPSFCLGITLFGSLHIIGFKRLDLYNFGHIYICFHLYMCNHRHNLSLEALVFFKMLTYKTRSSASFLEQARPSFSYFEVLASFHSLVAPSPANPTRILTARPTRKFLSLAAPNVY